MYLREHNWEPFLYERLNNIIEKNKNNNNYMVFDFDQTIVTGDVEEHLMYYMAKNFLYKIEADEFEKILKTDLSKDKKINDVADDLIELFGQLKKEFVSGSDIHNAYMAKLIYFYYNVYQYIDLQNGIIYPTYFFAGYTQTEMDNLCKEMIQEMTKSEIKKVKYKTPSNLKGKSGQIESEFFINLRFNPEILDLFEVLSENNIVPHIISASPESLLKGVVKASPLKLHEKSCIFGMSHEYKEDKIHSKIEADRILTRKEGKTEVINKHLLPKHNQKHPLGVFGDSMGDYSMLTEFSETKLRVLFNRKLEDQTKDFKERAKTEYGQDSATYFVQGKDYRESEFIRKVESII